MLKTTEEISKIIDPKLSVYCLKLVSGDTIIGKSNDDTDGINERGYVNLIAVMSLKKHMFQLPNGEVADILLINPWHEGASIKRELPIPTDTIISIVEAEPSISDQYMKFLLGYLSKENQNAKRGIANNMEHQSSEQPGKDQESKMYQPNLPPRQPERLSSDVMMESEMKGEFEEEQQEEKEPHYKIFGITIH